jgi:hypothetical protein
MTAATLEMAASLSTTAFIIVTPGEVLRGVINRALDEEAYALAKILSGTELRNTPSMRNHSQPIASAGGL